MGKKRILYSWVGHNDLVGMAGDAEPDQQRRILDELKIDRKISKQDGPIKALLKQETFDEIHLLSNYPKWLSGMFLEWLGFESKIHTVSLKDPTDYEQILTATDIRNAKTTHHRSTGIQRGRHASISSTKCWLTKAGTSAKELRIQQRS